MLSWWGFLLNHVFYQRGSGVERESERVCVRVCVCVYDIRMLFSQVGCVLCV